MNTSRRVAVWMLMTISMLIGMTPVPGRAACQCLCVNGEVEAICSSSLDVQPVCAPRVCPIVPPSVRPIDPPRVPPVGASRCRSEQVWNGEKYVWVEICQ